MDKIWDKKSESRRSSAVVGGWKTEWPRRTDKVER